MGIYDNRDYNNLHDKNLAVYNFRGYTVFKFHKKEKELEIGENANMCSFITADYMLMAKFLVNCYLFAKGISKDIKNIEVD